MVASSVQCLTQIASYLRVPGGKINLNDDFLPTRVSNKNTNTGYMNIIYQLLKDAKSHLGGNNSLEEAEVRQWIEYGVVYAAQIDSTSSAQQVLKELNSVLATRTYLVAYKLTVADLFLYYILQNAMESLSIIEKEKYLNVSRWFDNLQQNATIRQSNKLIDFTTNYLAKTAPARH